MKNAKRLLTTLLMLTMLLGMSAGTTWAVAEEAPMYPMEGNPTVTMVRVISGIANAGLTSSNDAPSFKAWEEQTGINIEISEVADDNALLLLFASGDIPDIIIMPSKNKYPGGIPKMVSDGLAIDLTDMLDDWAPDFKNFMDNNELHANAVREADGRYYTFGGYMFPEGSPYRSWLGMTLRKDYLEQLGMDVPETADEFYTYLSRTKNELGVAVPLCSDKAWVPNLLKSGILTSPFGLPSADWYHENGTIHYGAYEPAYRDALEYMNKLYAEGLLDPNFAVTDEATAQASMISGDSSAIICAASRIQVMTNAAASDDFNLVPMGSLVASKGDRPMMSHADPYVSSAFWSFVSSTCKNVEAAMKLLNYPFTEEGNILYNFGTEGDSFEYVDGKPVFTERMTKDPDYALDVLLRVHTLINYTGVHQVEMSEQRFPMQEQRDAYTAWSDSGVDSYQIANNSVLEAYADELMSLEADITTFVDESRARFISGATPLSEFDSYLETLQKMGIERLIEIRQESYDVYNK